ncbi:MAG: hypothetical protein CMO98_02500 [Woeseia sp.]|nr:hypothetical protein [Woeseia sp.]|tara:strand:+ start:726 stop:1127 length:402 start_codon:yes stop_codon:yes gene_type:complete
MKHSFLIFFIRLMSVVFVTVGAMIYVLKVESGVAYPFRNLVPMLVVILLTAITLKKGGGQWAAAGWCWPLGTLGFAIPAIGLSLYLHYGYEVDLNGMYSESIYPNEVFRYLPFYTIFAGFIGFAIGWIIGKKI